MANPGRLPRSRPALTVPLLVVLGLQWLHHLGASPMTVRFPALAGGAASESVAVPMQVNGETVLVTVVMPGANPAAPVLLQGERQITARLVGHDATSRLGFLRGSQDSTLKPPEWLGESGQCLGGTLQGTANGKTVPCRATGWVNKVGGKVLPLALLQVSFDGAAPPPGTPLMDSSNRVAGLFFQAADAGCGYAIPVEAVHRLKRDIMHGGEPVRAWLGLSLSSESRTARVVRVLTDSPAALAGIMPGDILLGVGPREVGDYSDVANAFFYLAPGVPSVLRVKRGTQTLRLSVTPTRPQRE